MGKTKPEGRTPAHRVNPALNILKLNKSQNTNKKQLKAGTDLQKENVDRFTCS